MAVVTSLHVKENKQTKKPKATKILNRKKSLMYKECLCQASEDSYCLCWKPGGVLTTVAKPSGRAPP
jgi:16S rRNA U516 pseudouridylate synthase RsuA-like enzyme